MLRDVLPNQFDAHYQNASPTSTQHNDTLLDYKLHPCPSPACKKLHEDYERQRQLGHSIVYPKALKLCNYWHGNVVVGTARDRRRDVRMRGSNGLAYTHELCTADACDRGDQCTNAHTEFERDFHANIYKIDRCTKCEFTRSPSDQWGFCPKAHSDIDLRDPYLHIGTVDSAQGSEADVVILSCVRCNPSSSLGFLKDPRRMCVALSRSKYRLHIVGNLSTIQGGDANWNTIIKASEEHHHCEPFESLTGYADCAEDEDLHAAKMKCVIDPSKCLGQGNYKVYEGKEHGAHGRAVAVKVVPSMYGRPQDVKAEQRAFEKLDEHPNIVRYYYTDFDQKKNETCAALRVTNLFVAHRVSSRTCHAVRRRLE